MQLHDKKNRSEDKKNHRDKESTKEDIHSMLILDFFYLM